MSKRLKNEPELKAKFNEVKNLQEGIAFSALSELLSETDAWEDEAVRPPHESDSYVPKLFSSDTSYGVEQQKKNRIFSKIIFPLIAASLLLLFFSALIFSMKIHPQIL